MVENNKFLGMTTKRNPFFSQAGIRISANIFLLLVHILTFLLGSDHTVMLITVGFMTICISEPVNFGDDIKCKLVLYLYKLMWGPSIYTTCLLSVLQALTLNPRSSYLAKCKHRSLTQRLSCFLFLCVFNVFFSTHFSISTIATPNVTLARLPFVTESRSLTLKLLPQAMFFTVMSFRVVTFIRLMTLSSGYMVILLYRHQRQTQHLHGTKLSPKASPEDRATQTILLLMGIFVLMYFVDCMLSSLITVCYTQNAVPASCKNCPLFSGLCTASD
uniref:Vomeronasal type-1 receptor n=1 Tax=Catagonus wagneri TaxID=51154 RepID=A0A8C3YNL2_9CETA